MSFRSIENDIDHAPDMEREQELAREQRWADLIHWLEAEQRGGCPWDALLTVIHTAFTAQRTNQPVRVRERILIDFAETEGWNGVLNALARAMRQAEYRAAPPSTPAPRSPQHCPACDAPLTEAGYRLEDLGTPPAVLVCSTCGSALTNRTTLDGRPSYCETCDREVP